MAKRKIIWLIIIAAAAYSLFSCGSSLEVPEGVYSSPSFYFHIQPIFTQNCVANGCHNSAAGGGLVLLQGPAYVNLVIKIEGNQTIGTRMPLGREPLDQVLIQNLINWVNKGAMNN
jgi:hypothetical protein